MITIPAKAGPIAFAGTSAFAARVLRALVSESLVPALVVTQPDRPAGRRRVVTPPPVAWAASEIGIPLIQPGRASEAAPALTEAGIGAVAICAYGNLIPPSLLEQRPWINLHPSALPRWRGAAPIERAIMAGDTGTEVCVMLLVEALDAGPVMARAKVEIRPDDTTGTLSDRLVEAGVPLLADVLRRIAAGPITAEEQPRDGATYAPKLGPDDRGLDPARARRGELDRIRALAPDIGARILLDDGQLIVWRAVEADDTVAEGQVSSRAGRLVVGFADGAVELLDVQAPGRSRLDAASFLRGQSRPIERATAA